ncbi:MAG: 50S ribosomal protein L37ae [Candidatus Nanoarchaeia archaeon]
MPSHTKKIGRAGRFGARYGLRIRKKVLEIEQVQKQKHKCPECFKFTLKRIASGIWLCKSCGSKFAGKAYEPGLEKPLAVQEIV